MSGMDGARREIQKLRLKLGERDFRGGAPPLDQDGLPRWDDAEPLTTEGYMAALGFAPDEELTEPELAARHRLSPYAAVFEKLRRDATEKEEEP
jgi:hypothetical protein